MSTEHLPPRRLGGLARYFVEHREVGWMALIAVLVWGWVSYGRLAQQEDPEIPDRRALLVTHWPGATAGKVEQLVTQKLEDKLNELEAVEEIKSQSRFGVSIIHITLRSAPESVVEQQWDKFRARIAGAELPAGCHAPVLDTDFGDTITLLYGITSPPASDAECRARAHLIRTRLAALRSDSGSTGRAAAFAFFPPDVARSFRENLQRKFLSELTARGLGDDERLAAGESFILVDFRARADAAALRAFMADFRRSVAGSDGELHPDFGGGVILMENEDPYPSIRATTPPRYSYRDLERVADALADDLKQVASVGRVRKIGNVPERVYLLFSAPNLEGYRLVPDDVIAAIATRNAVIPGGVFRAEGQNFPVQLSGEFTNELHLLDAIVAIAGGRSPTGARAPTMPVYLRDLFEVRRGYENPIQFHVDVLQRDHPEAPLTAHRSVLLAVEMKAGHVIGRFNEEVGAVVRALEPPRLPEGVRIVTLSDQPTAVRGRVHQFMKCFLEAVVVVVLVALFLMDWRSAAIVATAIPLTIAMTLGGMGVLDVPLHQISIAALIIALGMLVDDPVVASDGINRELAHGQARDTAAWLGPWKLRRAILFGTVINIVAFLPLVLLPADKGAFIVALPVVVTLALVSSRIVSMTFIPLLGWYWLRGQKGLEAGGEVRRFPLFRPVDRALVALLPRYQALLRAALDNPWRAIGVAFGLFVLSFGLTPFFGAQFFPPAERNQLLVDIELPESASIAQTGEACAAVVQVLARHPEVRSAAMFVGGTAPRFYYNVAPREPGNHLGQFLINTWRAEDVPPLLVALRAELDQEIAGARCVVKQLEQGPPVETPIQLRLSGDDLDTLRRLADDVAAILRDAGGYKVHDDLGRRMPTLVIEIDQQRANTLGISNRQIGRVAQAAFHEIPVTELREGDHLVPVVIRQRIEERNEAERIRTLYVRSVRDEVVPLDNFASVNLRPEYANIAHFNQLRAVTVKAFSRFGELPSRVLDRARPQLRALALPAGYRLDFAGEEKELRESRAEMGGVMLVSLSLIALAMVIQFSSVTKSLVVMLTVPLGLIGAFIGVTLFRAPMGFMALLGIVSLAGVIVSHIIVLSDFIEEARAEGMELKEALVQAGLVRLRAVLVTVLATVGGLIPLALTGGELWRPLTAVHICGLLLATLLTLVMLPVLYYVFCARLKWIK
ncbi:MAG: efflux RND transporter permease subunit [Verrucomicrobia bacterium]|nr:efflux RND transporter permease subunit [Verrucomicrobiota bacterium]